MAEQNGTPIGRMVIEMDLNNANFNNSLTSTNKALKSAEKEMKANIAVMNSADDKYGAMTKQVEGLNKMMQLNESRIQQLNAKREKLLETEDASSEAVRKLNDEINTAVTRQARLQQSVERTQTSMQEFQREVQHANSTLGKLEARVEKFGEQADKMGSKLTSTVTPALGAMGLAIGKVGLDADKSAAKLKNALGLTVEESAKAQKSVNEIWSDGFGDSMGAVTDAVLQVKQNMKDLNETDLIDITKQAMVLSETFGSDINEVTRAGNNIMKNFGVTSTEAMDLMTVGAQNGLNMSNEMFDNLTEYAPLFATMGYSAEDMFNTLISGASEGVYNLDYVNDVLKEFQIRIKDGSKSTDNAMGEMSSSTQKLWKDFENGKGTVKGVNDAVLKELSSMDDQILAGQLGVSLYGTKFEDLESTAMYALGNVDDKMGDVNGSAKELTETVELTFSQQATAVFREYGNALIPLGETLLELAEDILPKVAEVTEDASEWIGNLSDNGKKAVLFAVGFGIALGPALKLLGAATKLFKFGRSAIVGFNTMLGGSAATLTAETAALTANTAAQTANNTARNGGTTAGKKPRRTTMNGSGTRTVTTANASRSATRRRIPRPPTVPTPPVAPVASTTATVGKGAKLLKGVKGAGAVGAVVGGGVLAYELATGNGTKESIGGGVGGLLGGIGGGAAAGAALGSVVPVVGTAIGGIAGGIIGGIAGDKIGASIGKTFDKEDKLKKAEKQAEKGADLNLNIKGVSESTQKALGEYDKLYQGAKTKLNQIMLSNTTVNTKIKNDTIKQFDSMKTSVLQSVDQRHKQELESARRALASNKNLTQQEKDDAIAKLQAKHKAERDITTNGNLRVKTIMENASKQKRALTTAEKNEIKKINEDMYNAKINKTAKSEAEATAIQRQRSKQRNDITTKEMNTTVKSADKEYKSVVKSAENKYKKKVENARVQYKELGVISKKEYDQIVEDAQRERTDTVVQAKKKKESIVKHANDQKNKTSKASEKQKKNAIENSKEETSGMKKAWTSFTGFFKDSWDWLVGLFGGKKASSPPSGASSKNTKSNAGKTNSSGQTQMYAKGTINGSHPGGRAIVGEIGPELGYLPGKGYTMLGSNGPAMYNLPKGSAVLPHDKTQAMLSNYNFPMYKNGSGDDDLFAKAWAGTKSVAKKTGNYVSDGVGYLKDKAVDAVDLIGSGANATFNKLSSSFGFKNKYPTSLNNLTVGGMGKWAKNKSLDMINSLFDSYDFGGDSSISNNFGVYDYLFNIAKKVMGSSLGKGLSITSGQRNGDPHDHGKHNAIDLSGFGSNGGYKNVAKWASTLPGVGYTIGDNVVFGKKYGNGSMPSWAKGHMNHVHISGTGGKSTAPGTGKWSGIATKALKMTGNYSKANLNALLYQMGTESGGNARAINNWDSNALRGTPSKGLMQVIDPTFKAHAQKGYNSNIYDPLSNILASINYTKSRYGSLLNGWKGKGYEKGGIINKQHLAMLGEGNREEVVIPMQPKPNMRSRALDLLSYASQKLTGNNVVAAANDNSAIVAQLVKQFDAMQEQTNVLIALLNKNTDVILDGKQIFNSVESHKNKQTMTRNIAKGI